MPSIKKSLFWNTLNTVGRLGISFIATIALARLLSPADFGVWGIITIFVSISELLSDSGMGGYIIKKQNLKAIDYSTLFVYNLVISVLLYVSIFIAAPFIANFYQNAEIIPAIRIASLAIVFQALGITATSKLLKELRFKELAIITIESGLFSFIVAIILAYYSFGFWALIYQHVIATLLSSVGVYAYTRHLPRLSFNCDIFKEQFSFGINLMGSSLLNSLSSNIGNNIIGKYFNLSLAGFYFQSSKLQGLSTSTISSIVDKTFFPVFSKINNDLELIQTNSSELSRRMFAYCFPVLLVIIFFAEFIVNMLLGPQWHECVPMLQFLMIASFPALGKAMNRNILKSTGYTHAIFRVELYSTAFLALVLGVAIILKSFWLIISSVVITQFISYIFSVFYLHSKCAFSIAKLFSNFAIFLPLALIPIISGLIFGFNAISFTFSFIPVIAIYRLAGVKEYQISFNNKGTRN